MKWLLPGIDEERNAKERNGNPKSGNAKEREPKLENTTFTAITSIDDIEFSEKTIFMICSKCVSKVSIYMF